MGFDQAAGVRLYAFQGDADGIRTDYTVGVDLALTASHGIRIQELPLLCRELLERQVEGTRAIPLVSRRLNARTMPITPPWHARQRCGRGSESLPRSRFEASQGL